MQICAKLCKAKGSLGPHMLCKSVQMWSFAWFANLRKAVQSSRATRAPYALHGHLCSKVASTFARPPLFKGGVYLCAATFVQRWLLPLHGHLCSTVASTFARPPLKNGSGTSFKGGPLNFEFSKVPLNFQRSGPGNHHHL